MPEPPALPQRPRDRLGSEVSELAVIRPDDLSLPSPECLHDPGRFEKTRGYCRERQWPRN
jgi:hypothetical protein